MIDIEAFSSAVADSVNEDCYGFSNIGNNAYVVVVADGMGGLSYGDVASKICVDVILDYCKTNYNSISNDVLLSSALIKANNAIAKENMRRHAKMGASVAVAIITDIKCCFSWLGDVRIYHLRKEEIEQVTTDHVAHGCDFSLLTRCMNGRAFRFPIEVKNLEIQSGDAIQIATDGYYHHNHITHEIAKPVKSFDDDATIINIRIKTIPNN